MNKPSPNPFSPPRESAPAKRWAGEHSQLVRAAFLYRVVDFRQPFAGRLVYDAWWWRQRVTVNEHVGWFRISWRRIDDRLEFAIPSGVDSREPKARIEIDFARGARIRCFRFYIAEALIYEEIN